MSKILGCNCVPNVLFGGSNFLGRAIRVSANNKFPQTALKLPTNVVDINGAEVGRFSPLRERDLSGPVISSHFAQRHEKINPGIDITIQVDPHTNKYDCRGAVSLSSSMQSNVPSPFSGNHTHLGMPGSQWGQGYKYLSDHLRSAHYLTLRNEYREKMFSRAATFGKRTISTDAKFSLNAKQSGLLGPIGKMKISTDTKFTLNAKESGHMPSTKDINSPQSTKEITNESSVNAGSPVSAKEKLKKAVKEYGSTVLVFHISISLISLGGFYVLVSSGVDVVGILKYFNVAEGTLSTIAASNAGTFVIAYAVHKFFAPVRIAITLTATPFIVRFLRNVGFLKHNVSAGGGK